MRRKLVLKKEMLAEITPVALGEVGGAAATPACIEPPTGICLPTYQLMCMISRLMYPCLTEPTLVCD